MPCSKNWPPPSAPGAGRSVRWGIVASQLQKAGPSTPCPFAMLRVRLLRMTFHFETGLGGATQGFCPWCPQHDCRCHSEHVYSRRRDTPADELCSSGVNGAPNVFQFGGGERRICFFTLLVLNKNIWNTTPACRNDGVPCYRTIRQTHHDWPAPKPL
jgi:hypothetical protein